VDEGEGFRVAITLRATFESAVRTSIALKSAIDGRAEDHSVLSPEGVWRAERARLRCRMQFAKSHAGCPTALDSGDVKRRAEEGFEARETYTSIAFGVTPWRATRRHSDARTRPAPATGR
jgi:hypothetical protein